MTERREIKQRSPAVWARVREAYLAGEPAASVARRFDVGIGNLRFRANAEGWTRKAAMERADAEAAIEDIRLAGRADEVEPCVALDSTLPEMDARTAVTQTLRRAATLIAAGRGGEATTLLKAAETLNRLTQAEANAPPPEPDPLTPEEDAAKEAAGKAAWEAVNREVERRADRLARAMLTDLGNPLIDYGAFALRWRAEVLGPEVAAQDRARHERDGTAGHYWRPDGEMRTQEEIDDASWDYMQCTVREALGLPAARPGQAEKA